MTDGRLVVVYDGQCAFCRARVDWIRRRDPAGRFEFLPSQASDLLARFPALAGNDLNAGMRLIEPDGRVWDSADAVYQIARRLPRWRRLAWLYRVPGLTPLCRSLYRWIARRRYSLTRSCDETCQT